MTREPLTDEQLDDAEAEAARRVEHRELRAAARARAKVLREHVELLQRLRDSRLVVRAGLQAEIDHVEVATAPKSPALALHAAISQEFVFSGFDADHAEVYFGSVWEIRASQTPNGTAPAFVSANDGENIEQTTWRVLIERGATSNQIAAIAIDDDARSTELTSTAASRKMRRWAKALRDELLVERRTIEADRDKAQRDYERARGALDVCDAKGRPFGVGLRDDEMMRIDEILSRLSSETKP